MAAFVQAHSVALGALAPPANPEVRLNPAPAIAFGDALSPEDMIAARREYKQLEVARELVTPEELRLAKARQVAVQVQHAAAEYPGIGVPQLPQLQQFLNGQFQQMLQQMQQQMQQQIQEGLQQQQQQMQRMEHNLQRMEHNLQQQYVRVHVVLLSLRCPIFAGIQTPARLL